MVPADDLLITSIWSGRFLFSMHARPLKRTLIPLLIAANFADKVIHGRDLGFTPSTGHKRDRGMLLFMSCKTRLFFHAYSLKVRQKQYKCEQMAVFELNEW